MIHVFLILDQFSVRGEVFAFDASLFKVHRIYCTDLDSYLSRQAAKVKKTNDGVVFIDSSFFDKEKVAGIDRIFEKYGRRTRLPIIVFCPPEKLRVNREYKLSNRDFTYCLQTNEAGYSEVYLKNLSQFITIILEISLWHERINDFIINSFRINVDHVSISRQKLEIEKLNRELIKLSTIDYLTSVLNRRAFFESMERERKRVLRFLWRLENEGNDKIKKERRAIYKHKPIGTIKDHCCKFSLVIIDIDNFKSVNDTRGHIVGDMVLKRVAETLLSPDLLRETDSTGRYGGEEFTILLADTNERNAFIVAERIHSRINNLEFLDSDKKNFSITVSIGISEFNTNDENIEAIIKRADDALYYAKNHGKNRIIRYSEICEGMT
ncbi:MAG: GGDEF domain-containing protein [Spirochaetales bacterium]|nr:GGDEF domain-containing protein [Spirochaetales bacterium]